MKLATGSNFIKNRDNLCPYRHNQSQNSRQYADSGINWCQKSFMKLATGSNVTKLFSIKSRRVENKYLRYYNFAVSVLFVNLKLHKNFILGERDETEISHRQSKWNWTNQDDFFKHLITTISFC
jgi:hypothetical protein